MNKLFSLVRLIALLTLVGTSAPLALAEPGPTVDNGAQSQGERYGKRDPLLGDVSVGPTLTLLGFPSPIRFGLESKYQDRFGLSVEYGLLPSFTISDVGIGLNSWNVAAKFYPFRRAFYIGLGFGSQSFTGSITDTVGVESVTLDLTVTSTVLTPHIGWRWVTGSGFFYGVELGAQIALSSGSTLSSSNPALQADPEYQRIKDDVESRGNTFGGQTLPMVALLQVGWLF